MEGVLNVYFGVDFTLQEKELTYVLGIKWHIKKNKQQSSKEISLKMKAMW